MFATSRPFPDCIRLGWFCMYWLLVKLLQWFFFCNLCKLLPVSEPSFMCCHQEWKMIQPLDVILVSMRNIFIIKYSLQHSCFSSAAITWTVWRTLSIVFFLCLRLASQHFPLLHIKECIFMLWLLKLVGKQTAVSKMTTQDYLNNSPQRAWTPVFPAERCPRVSRTHVQRLLFKLCKTREQHWPHVFLNPVFTTGTDGTCLISFFFLAESGMLLTCW